MPYSTGADGKPRTPGGCRVDNGLCIEFIAYNWSQGYVEFTLEGAKYYVRETPFATDSVFWDFTNRPDPGCVWNNRKRWNSPAAGLLKEEPSNDPRTDLWIFAAPPEYKPST